MPLSGCLELRCERRIALLGCHLFRSLQPPARLPRVAVSLAACNDAEDAPLPQQLCPEASYQPGQLMPYYTVTFPRPALMQPGCWYRLRLSLSDHLPSTMADAPLPEPGNKAVLLRLRAPACEPYAAFLCALLCHYVWPLPPHLLTDVA